MIWTSTTKVTEPEKQYFFNFIFEKKEHTDKPKVKKPRTTQQEKKRKRENVLYFLAELYLSVEHVNNSAYCRQSI